MTPEEVRIEAEVFRFRVFLDRLETALENKPQRIRFDTEWTNLTIAALETAADAGTIGPETDAEAA